VEAFAAVFYITGEFLKDWSNLLFKYIALTVNTFPALQQSGILTAVLCRFCEIYILWMHILK
jgi:hypothetical protein